MTIAIGILAVVVAAVGIVATVVRPYLGGRAERIEHSQQSFREAREHLKSARTTLSQAARRLYQTTPPTDLPLLFDAGWLPSRPLALEAVHVEAMDLDSGCAPLKGVARRLPRTRTYGRYESYSDAVAELIRADAVRNLGHVEAAGDNSGPLQFENRVSYRLTSVEPGETAWTIRVGKTHYFDMLNTCEAVGFEFSAADLDRRTGHEKATAIPRMGPGRQEAGGPFQLDRRCIVPGINTLTIRSDGLDAGFFMHRRDLVATAMGTNHVVPAGEFQPAGIDPTGFAEDADIWRTIVRESAEELLGHPDAGGGSGATIDYDHDEPYSSINKARQTGGCRAYFLGLGIDPLSLKAEVLTVCVFKADVFDRIFRKSLIKMKSKNAEGTLLTGRDYRGNPFDLDHVRKFTSDTETLPAGTACLALAWQWRDQILKPPASGRRPTGRR